MLYVAIAINREPLRGLAGHHRITLRLLTASLYMLILLLIGLGSYTWNAKFSISCFQLDKTACACMCCIAAGAKIKLIGKGGMR